MATKLFKKDDKVMILGIGYVNEVLEDSYYVYIINKHCSGSGYQDADLTLGWTKATWEHHRRHHRSISGR